MMVNMMISDCCKCGLLFVVRSGGICERFFFVSSVQPEATTGWGYFTIELCGFSPKIKGTRGHTSR